MTVTLPVLSTQLPIPERSAEEQSRIEFRRTRSVTLTQLRACGEGFKSKKHSFKLIIDAPSRPTFTPEELKSLTKRFPRVNAINARGNPLLSDKHLEYIARFKRIEELDIAHSPNVTDLGVARLASLRKLYSLDISSCSALSGRALQALANNSNLRNLFLMSLPIDDADLMFLKDLPELLSLDVSECSRVTAAGLIALAPHLPKIAHFGLSFPADI